MSGTGIGTIGDYLSGFKKGFLKKWNYWNLN